MKVNKINDDSLQFDFRIYNEEFEHYLNFAFDQIKSKIQIKGFRKGFLSRSVFKIKIGDKKLYKEALDILIKDKTKEILKNKNKFSVIGEPKLVSCGIENLEKNSFFDFTLEFYIKPNISLCNYKGIKINSFSEEDISESEIKEKMDLIFKKEIFSSSKGNNLPLEEEDIAIFDLKIFYDNEMRKIIQDLNNISLEVGKDQFIPGFDQGIKGMKMNDKRTFSLLIPDEFYDKRIASKKIFFEIFLKDIKVKKDLIFNDDFIKNMKIPNILTLSDLKEKIREKLKNEKKNYFKQKNEEEVLDFLIKNSVVELSKNLIIDEVNTLNQNFMKELKNNNLDLDKYLEIYKISKNEFNLKIEKQAIRNLKVYFILNEIMEIENIKILPQELEKYYKEISLNYNIDILEVKQKYFLIQKVKKEILIKKTIDFLLKNSIYKSS
ncbi:trigger factor [Candidatus Phytoplasma oryzae]|nr:trigger factor [Candidatus Phytoplasma oryzae]